MPGGLGGNKEFKEAAMEVRSEGSKWVEVLVEGKLGRNNALRLADAKQVSALRVSVICYFILEQPCGSPCLAFATHSRSMPQQASATTTSAASSSTSTSSGSRAAGGSDCPQPAANHNLASVDNWMCRPRVRAST